MAEGQRIMAHLGLDMETGENYLDPHFAAFIKNLDTSVNKSDKGDGTAANEYKFTPLPGSALYAEIDFFPPGVNRTCGFYESRMTRTGYVFVHNDQGQHFIYRISGATGHCERVLQASWLNFSLSPERRFKKPRCTDVQVARINPVTGLEEEVTALIFVDDFGVQREVFVEDCIATSGFDPVLHPYFGCADPELNPDTFTRLGVVPPMDMPEVQPIQRSDDTTEELDKFNGLNNKAIQFRMKFIDVWGRESEHGPISELYLNNSGTGGIADSQGLPRSVTLRSGAGSPLVDKIQVEYRVVTGNVRGLTTASDWMLYDTVDKYDNCRKVQWWERLVNPALGFQQSDNSFEYVFSMSKECELLPVEETNRLFNPMPITSGAVCSINRRLALSRNRRYFQPLGCEELGKISYKVSPPAENENTCTASSVMRKIEIYGYIWNPFHSSMRDLYQMGDNAIFGPAESPGLPGPIGNNNDAYYYNQVLPSGQEGIIGYLAGTKYYVISRQYSYNRTTHETEYVGLEYRNESRDGHWAIQKWEFTVPPGKYVFRIASHTASPSDDFEKTSARLYGQSNLSHVGITDTILSELMIDCCDGDVEVLQDALMLIELVHDGNRSNFAEGYLREDEIGKAPIEGARVHSRAASVFTTPFTDHNGYYMIGSLKRKTGADLYGWKNCQPNQKIAAGRTAWDATRYRYDELYAYEQETEYPEADRYLVKGKITLCDKPDIGIPSALVILTGGGAVYTNSAGEFTIAAHRRGDGTPVARNVIVSQRGINILVDCSGDCASCFPDIPVTEPHCSGASETVLLTSLSLGVLTYEKRGPQMGGQYGIAIIRHDWMGRQTPAEMMDSHYVTIPSLIQTKIYDYSRISYDLSKVVFPPETKYLSFAVTENLNFDDFMTWIVDKVEFVDNTGEVNLSAPTAIRLYYESLNQYNIANPSSNTRWQFMDAEDDLVRRGDLVEFLLNGDASIFAERITALVQYDKTGQYIQVEHSDKLSGLTEGAQVKLIRPRECINKQFFYEIGQMVRIKDGKAIEATGDIPVIDSYLQTRQIPVPVYAEDGSIDHTELHSYSFPFEHHSPSDLWGDHAWNKGRVTTTNPYQQRKYFKMEVAPSKSLSVKGSFNGLSYFEEADIVEFDDQQWGGITAVISNVSAMLIICEQANFVVAFDDRNIYVDAQGAVQARSGTNSLGRPQRSPGSDFGCQMDDLNTIEASEGRIFFLDRQKGRIVVHDFSSAKALITGKALNWLNQKIKSVSASPDRYFHAVVDPKRNAYLLTDALISAQDADYLNHEWQANVAVPETISVSLADNSIRFLSFIPECFGALSGDKYDQQLFSFKQGKPWRHYDMNGPADSFNSFFGVPVKPVYEVVFNDKQANNKSFLWVEVYCRETLFYIDRILTESGQQSRLMPKWFDRRNKFFAADFKSNVLSQPDESLPVKTGAHVLTEGDPLIGSWLKARFVQTSSSQGQYFELISVAGYWEKSDGL